MSSPLSPHRLWLALLFIALGTAAANLALVGHLFQHAGWDASHHCGCAAAIREGADPYAAQAGQPFAPEALRCTYAPCLYALVYGGLICLADARLTSFIVALLAPLLLIAFSRPRDGEDLVFQLGLYFGGFTALQRALLSGNIAPLEMLAIGAAATLLSRGSVARAAWPMAIGAALKLQPLALAAAAAFCLPRKDAMAFGLRIALAFLAIAGVCLICAGGLMPSYYNFVTASLGGSAQAGIVETGAFYDFSSMNFLGDLEELAYGGRANVLYALFAAAAACMLWKLARSAIPPERKALLAMLLALLILPRLKDYSFTLFLPPLALLNREAPIGMKCRLLAICNALPLLLDPTPSIALEPAFGGAFLGWVRGYTLFWCAALAAALSALLQFKAPSARQ